jgi:chorismate mutase
VLRVVEVRHECALAAGRLRQARGALPRDSLRRAEVRVDALDTASNQRLAEPELEPASRVISSATLHSRAGDACAG